MERRGPLVHRAVRLGSLALIAAGALLLLANVVPALSYSGFNGAQTLVEQLGNPANSPLALVFDLMMIVSGIALILGAWLVWGGLPARGSRTLGLLLLMVTGVAALGVGTFPSGSAQDVGGINGTWMIVLFLAAGLSLLILTLAMLRDRRWDGRRLYTLLSGVVLLIAFLLYHDGLSGALGPGGAERLGLAALIVWLFVIGVHLVRIPVYSARSRGPISS